jgi:hypothetical protein
MNKNTKFWVRLLCWILAGLMVSGAVGTIISFLL